jgi:hypothetical protein
MADGPTVRRFMVKRLQYCIDGICHVQVYKPTSVPAFSINCSGCVEKGASVRGAENALSEAEGANSAAAGLSMKLKLQFS